MITIVNIICSNKSTFILSKFNDIIESQFSIFNFQRNNKFRIFDINIGFIQFLENEM